MVQRGARMSRSASQGFGEKKEIKVWLYASHLYDMCNQCQTIRIQIRPNILSCLIWVETVWRADYAGTCLRPYLQTWVKTEEDLKIGKKHAEM